jgi:transcriptional regulator GlxA family with amidase domain
VKTAVLALPGVLDVSLGMTLDILGACNRLRTEAGQDPVFRPVLTSMLGSQVRTGAGLLVGPAMPASRLPVPDLIILPGANLPLPDEVDAWLASSLVARSIEWLRAMAQQGAEITASCASTFVLAEAGLLEGRSATTTWWLAPHFQRRYPHITLDMNRMVVRDGPITCAGAALAQADLMLSLVARHAGPATARLCASYLLLDHRVSQTRYALVDHLARQHPVVDAAERWIRTHLSRPFSIGELAQALHVTPRTLARRFASTTGLTPQRFIQRLRVEHAIHLMETTARTLSDVAERVGYADVSTLRRLVVRHKGTTPREIRNAARSRQLARRDAR